MSFVDLATQAMHRRAEMEKRINEFSAKCDQVQVNVAKLKKQAQGFVSRLNCSPDELRDRFLSLMHQLDEYTYLITDFNLAVSKIDESANREISPVHDAKAKPPPGLSVHLLDVLSETQPLFPTACANKCPLPEAVKKRKKPKTIKEDVLIQFSSASCSQTSVQEDVTDAEEKVEAGPPAKEIESLSLSASPPASRALPRHNLPAQRVPAADEAFEGCIMSADGGTLWIVIDDFEALSSLMVSMTEFYRDDGRALTPDEVSSLTYCALYDDTSETAYRCLFIKLIEGTDLAELFLVDTGELMQVRYSQARPLERRYCALPPFARCSHLAGIELMASHVNEMQPRQDKFMRSFIGERCDIIVDDNTSESLGVYIRRQSTGDYLHQLIIMEGLAISESQLARPPDAEPELDDPLVAVTGYHNRDEADICKHYKGGPDKTCFKGSRCTKRHVVKHPDGWTLDRVEVCAGGVPLPLPPPRSRLRARVTTVPHFDRVYLQLAAGEEAPKADFGSGPATLQALLASMNSPETRHESLEMAPAVGQLVAALYPVDGLYYRAMVLGHAAAEQTVQVRYIDYGNTLWVRAGALARLGAAHARLPRQAVLARLAGVARRTEAVQEWARAKERLSEMTLDKEVECHVIARDYTELVVELFDLDGYNVAEQLAASRLVKLTPYAVQDDSDCRPRTVVP